MILSDLLVVIVGVQNFIVGFQNFEPLRYKSILWIQDSLVLMN
jgi:hypothetical protein